MMQKTRPIEAFQQVLSAFKLFEKKLDKLQDDVNSHGHTLSDLRILVSNLASGADSMMPKLDEKRPRKSMAVQYDNHPTQPPESFKTKRKNNIQSLPSKMKTKSYAAPTLFGMRTIGEDSTFGRHTSTPKIKHSPRPGKAFSARKMTTLRAQKGREKNRNKAKTK